MVLQVLAKLYQNLFMLSYLVSFDLKLDKIQVVICAVENNVLFSAET